MQTLTTLTETKLRLAISALTRGINRAADLADSDLLRRKLRQQTAVSNELTRRFDRRAGRGI